MKFCKQYNISFRRFLALKRASRLYFGFRNRYGLHTQLYINGVKN